MSQSQSGSLEGCNSQESDTLVSLERLPEAGQGSSQMEGDSQHLSLEVDASSQTAGSQLSSEISDHSADPPLEGNFPAVNIVSSREPARPPAGPGAAGEATPRGIKSGGKDRGAAPPGAPALASPGAAAQIASPSASESASQRAEQSAGASPSAPTLEAEANAADVLLSLHRAEGFGLTLAEAMAAGLPVVATGYSGNLDFMPPGSAELVPYRLVPIGRTEGDYREGWPWADPDLDAAAAALRRLALDANHHRRQALAGRAAVQGRLAPEALAAVVRQRLGCLLRQAGRAELLQALPANHALRHLE